jgi:hypothetical protein
MLDEGSIPSRSTRKVFMENWTETFPALNLYNYHLFYKWLEEFNDENPSDGPDQVSTA